MFWPTSCCEDEVVGGSCRKVVRASRASRVPPEAMGEELGQQGWLYLMVTFSSTLLRCRCFFVPQALCLCLKLTFWKTLYFDLIFDRHYAYHSKIYSCSTPCCVSGSACLPRSEILCFATLSSSKADNLLLFSSSRLRCVSLKSLSTSGDAFPSPSEFPLYFEVEFSAWVGCCCCCTCNTCYSLICTLLAQHWEQQEGSNLQLSVWLLHSSLETSVISQPPVFLACIQVCHRAWTISWRSRSSSQVPSCSNTVACLIGPSTSKNRIQIILPWYLS